MNVTALRCALVIALGSACGAAVAAEPVWRSDAPVVWPRWQARLGVVANPALESLRPLQSAAVLGDYYLTGPGFGGGRVGGGLRATSGLYAGSLASTLSSPAVPRSFGSSLTLSSRRGLSWTSPPDGSADAIGTIPYVGLGYTGTSLRGGWGFTADIGLVGLTPNSGLRLGRGPAPSVDDLLRDLRLTPVLQLGVSYQF